MLEMSRPPSSQAFPLVLRRTIDVSICSATSGFLTEAIEIGASESQSSQTSRRLLFVQSAANDNVHVNDNQCLYTI